MNEQQDIQRALGMNEHETSIRKIHIQECAHTAHNYKASLLSRIIL